MNNDTGAFMLADEKRKREEFEAETVAFVSDGKPVMMAEARVVFDCYHHTPNTDWKRPVFAIVIAADVSRFESAVEFYHGSRPTVTKTKDARNATYVVTGPGYVC